MIFYLRVCQGLRSGTSCILLSRVVKYIGESIHINQIYGQCSAKCYLEFFLSGARFSWAFFIVILSAFTRTTMLAISFPHVRVSSVFLPCQTVSNLKDAWHMSELSPSA